MTVMGTVWEACPKSTSHHSVSVSDLTEVLRLGILFIRILHSLTPGENIFQLFNKIMGNIFAVFNVEMIIASLTVMMTSLLVSVPLVMLFTILTMWCGVKIFRR